MLVIDGTMGEGGGQILRSCLALSIITGRDIRISHVRGRRKKPGLMRQHLKCVEAASEIARADVTGAKMHSTQLTFRPGKVAGGNYRWSIGSAGSTSLVLQTVLPPLVFAKQTSKLSISGGTNNPLSPPFEFLDLAFFPLLKRMGVDVHRTLMRRGFNPAGGGKVKYQVPVVKQLSPLHLTAPKTWKLCAYSFVSAVPRTVAERELDALREQLPALAEEDCHIVCEQNPRGPGNMLMIVATANGLVNAFAHFGRKGYRSQLVAEDLANEWRAFANSGAAVEEHLADQLPLWMALAGGGSFTTNVLAGHLETHLALLEMFLPVSTQATKQSDAYLVEIKKIAAAEKATATGC